MKIAKATRKYERWLSQFMPLLRADLEAKHAAMAGDPFPFLRATFYRWMQLWPDVCPQLAGAPRVLAVGDLHVDNFGTWRDSEGRLTWGINDFDEAYPLPYVLDMVRLATSACLIIRSAHLALHPRQACATILDGYAQSLKTGGRPIVLGEHHHWLRELAMSNLRDPVRFWAKLEAIGTYRGQVPEIVRKILPRALPEKGLEHRLVHRQAGLGSLGRPRFTALADWHGGKLARETKALAPSAVVWAACRGSERIQYESILRLAVRCHDPFLRRHGKWIVRRLAPDCSRVEMSSLPEKSDEKRLLWEMGWETANVHLGSHKRMKAVLHDLAHRPADWLLEASLAMTEAITHDWKQWQALYQTRRE